VPVGTGRSRQAVSSLATRPASVAGAAPTRHAEDPEQSNRQECDAAHDESTIDRRPAGAGRARRAGRRERGRRDRRVGAAGGPEAGRKRHDQPVTPVGPFAAAPGVNGAAGDRQRGPDDVQVDGDLEEIVARSDVRRDRDEALEVTLVDRGDRPDQASRAIGLRDERDFERLARSEIAANLDRRARLDPVGAELEDRLSVRGDRRGRPEDDRGSDGAGDDEAARPMIGDNRPVTATRRGTPGRWTGRSPCNGFGAG
jgi:hypothetical protein